MHIKTMPLSVSDTCLVIILLLPLKTPIKYEWILPSSSVLTWLSWVPASPIIGFYDVKLPSIRSHLIYSLPGHPAWRSFVPLDGGGGAGAALSNSLIKAVIRPNPELLNELLSGPGVPDSSRGQTFLIYKLTKSPWIFILMRYSVINDIISTGLNAFLEE